MNERLRVLEEEIARLQEEYKARREWSDSYKITAAIFMYERVVQHRISSQQSLFSIVQCFLEDSLEGVVLFEYVRFLAEIVPDGMSIREFNEECFMLMEDCYDHDAGPSTTQLTRKKIISLSRLANCSPEVFIAIGTAAATTCNI